MLADLVDEVTLLIKRCKKKTTPVFSFMVELIHKKDTNNETSLNCKNISNTVFPY